MKIIVAPDSFKDSLSAKEAAGAIAAGVTRVFPAAKVVQIPLADGGEGTVEALVEATGGQYVQKIVTGPLGEKVRATYGLLNDSQRAVIEIAAASGLPLVPKHRRNPLRTTTYGSGELIKDALNQGCRSFIIGLGGSATVDGGVGLLQALGGRFVDSEGREIGFGGGELGRLAYIDLSGMDPRIYKSTFLLASDVENPLCGPRGAAAAFGPQKGATPEMVQLLDQNLARLADVIERQFQKQVSEIPGAGAAGGLGAGLLAFLPATMRPGIDIVMETTGFKSVLPGTDLVITGEGKIDGQTLYGKTPYGVAKEAKELGIPVIAIAGQIGEGAHCLFDHGIDSIVTLVEGPCALEEAIADARPMLTRAAERTARLLAIGMSFESFILTKNF